MAVLTSGCCCHILLIDVLIVVFLNFLLFLVYMSCFTTVSKSEILKKYFIDSCAEICFSPLYEVDRWGGGSIWPRAQKKLGPPLSLMRLISVAVIGCWSDLSTVHRFYFIYFLLYHSLLITSKS